MKQIEIKKQNNMKWSSFIILIFLAAVLQSCQDNHQKPKEVDLSQEKETILAVIENESRDFYRKDHTAWSNHYVHTPEIFWACVEKDVTLRASGWQDLSQFVARWMKDNPEPMDYDVAEFKLSDVKITISGELAFVTMKSANIQPDGTLRTLNGNRTMKKINGEWKILSMTSYPSDLPEGSTPNVYVHQ
jgi:ketosteroid isomerase-like protein